MRKALCATLVLLLSALIGCASGGGTNHQSNQSSQATVSSIQISPTSMSIGTGSTQQFSATAHMSDGTSNDITGTVRWSSSDPSIASITTGGMATGSTQGTVIITAQSTNLSATATLTVSGAVLNLTSIVVSPGAYSLPVNTTQQFTATGNYADGSSADLTALVSWSSLSNSIATVTASGLVAGVSAGNTNISASLGGVSGSTSLTVTTPTLVSISVTPVGQTLAIGINQQYVATATYSDGSTADLSSGVTWTSSSTSIATVNTSGLVTTVAAGQTTITAAISGLSDTSTLTVVGAHLTSIAVGPSVQAIAVGTSQQFTAVGSFDDGSTQLLQSVTWSSSLTSVASVDVNGVATGVGTGVATITATSGSVSGTATLTISAATLVSITITPANSSMAVGTTKQFAATGTFSDSSNQDITAAVVWTSSAPTAASINAQGLASSVAPGSTTITAAYGSVSGSTGLTVSTAHLVSITVSPANPRIAKGTSIKFTATGSFSDGSVATNLSGVSWKSSKPNIASVRSSGIAHGKKGGTVTITASSSGISGNTTLTVGTGTLVSLSISPTAPTAPAGSTQQFAATGTFSDGSTQDITLNTHWSSSSASVATIANAPSVAGLANCLAAGTTTIGVNSGGITGSDLLTVQ